MWNLKKGHNELLCRTDSDSQTLKNLWFLKETGRGLGDALGLWDGKPIKLDCDDHCTTISVINSLSNKKILEKKLSLVQAKKPCECFLSPVKLLQLALGNVP